MHRIRFFQTIWALVPAISVLAAETTILAAETTMGDDAVLECHCYDDKPCTETGFCRNGCTQGFYGPGCQIGNIAKYKEANQSSTARTQDLTPQRANDGRYPSLDDDQGFKQCSQTQDSSDVSWWQVIIDAVKMHVITNITIVNRPDVFASSLKMFKIYLSNDTTAYPQGTWVLCADQQDAAPFVSSFACKGINVARAVAVVRTKTETSLLMLCEVMIGGHELEVTNIAKNKQAMQSTTKFKYDFPASRAVDGSYYLDSNDGPYYGTCSQTQMYDPLLWWQVVLGASNKFFVSNITVINVPDMYASLLNNFTVFLSNDTTDYPSARWTKCANHPAAARLVTVLSCTGTKIARSVAIVLEQKTERTYLILCEVLVYGYEIRDNIAEGRPAMQSTTSLSIEFPASSAVDGKFSSRKDVYFDLHQCSLTEGNATVSWWQVVLGKRQQYFIEKISIINRPDKFAERLSNFTIYLSNDTENYPAGIWKVCASHLDVAPFISNFSCLETKVAQSVAIVQTKIEIGTLALCEVVIHGYAVKECQDGFSGPGCLLIKCNSDNCKGVCSPNGGCLQSSCPHAHVPPDCWIRLPDLLKYEWNIVAKNGTTYITGTSNYSSDVDATLYLVEVNVTTVGSELTERFTVSLTDDGPLTFSFPSRPDHSYNIRVHPESCLDTHACRSLVSDACSSSQTCFRGMPSALLIQRGNENTGTTPNSSHPQSRAASFTLLQCTALAAVGFCLRHAGGLSHSFFFALHAQPRRNGEKKPVNSKLLVKHGIMRLRNLT